MNLWIDLPRLSTFTTGSSSFRETTSLDLSSIFWFILLSTDVPFKNGKYTHGSGYAFYSLSCSSIQSDSSLFLLIHFIHSLYKPQTTNSISFRETISLIISSFLHHSPQSVTLLKKSKYPSSHSPIIPFLPSFLTHTNLPLSCRN